MLFERQSMYNIYAVCKTSWFDMKYHLFISIVGYEMFFVQSHIYCSEYIGLYEITMKLQVWKWLYFLKYLV